MPDILGKINWDCPAVVLHIPLPERGRERGRESGREGEREGGREGERENK
jgi:hypothetical protein|tara:strand:- start:666 stop:815 length:150 start_codon:yes stop_codon:yes gene_type:complete